ncbi:MAG: 50S ribosomal protein L30 [Cyanobacteria bacterium TGS_CYA1]|nr:50S ribosomal protein L30 [Cyanobacteria bacterium TGS_CYA1]
MSSIVKITLKKGMIGRTETQKKIVKALGLGKFGTSAVHYTSPSINGMLDKVSHLVEVTEAKASDEKDCKKKVGGHKAKVQAKAKTAAK